MGVPGLFRDFVNKYPDILFLKNNFKIHNLYFDANGIFHTVAYMVLSEYETSLPKNIDDIIIKNILIEFKKILKECVSHVQLIYISIDGPPPLAKIHQQRTRRFKSAKLTELTNKIYKKYNKPVKKEWQRSKITPGTVFMFNLCNEIKQYIKNDLKNYTVYFADSNVPEEAEHRIFKHIREHGKNKINCVYGLDADLIYLSMLSKHKIYLLRDDDEIKQYRFLSINKLKKYISNDIINKIDLEKNINKNKIICDFIIYGFLLGNDFIPHIPG